MDGSSEATFFAAERGHHAATVQSGGGGGRRSGVSSASSSAAALSPPIAGPHAIAFSTPPTKAPTRKPSKFSLSNLLFSSAKATGDAFDYLPEIPEGVQLHILSFLGLQDLLQFNQVSCYAYVLASHDSLWKPIFSARFPLNPEQADPLLPGGALHGMSLRAAYAHRLRNPCPGDILECRWEGQYSLVADNEATSYCGKAWWSAKVLSRHEPDSFKISYLAWDSSAWDEAVPRSRLRWPPVKASIPLDFPLKRGDLCELHCASTFGRSPWLECTIEAVHPGGIVDVGAVVQNDPEKQLQPRANLRLVLTKEEARKREKEEKRRVELVKKQQLKWMKEQQAMLKKKSKAMMRDGASFGAASAGAGSAGPADGLSIGPHGPMMPFPPTAGSMRGPASFSVSPLATAFAIRRRSSSGSDAAADASFPSFSLADTSLVSATSMTSDTQRLPNPLDSSRGSHATSLPVMGLSASPVLPAVDESRIGYSLDEALRMRHRRSSSFSSAAAQIAPSTPPATTPSPTLVTILAPGSYGGSASGSGSGAGDPGMGSPGGSSPFSIRSLSGEPLPGNGSRAVKRSLFSRGSFSFSFLGGGGSRSSSGGVEGGAGPGLRGYSSPSARGSPASPALLHSARGYSGGHTPSPAMQAAFSTALSPQSSQLSQSSSHNSHGPVPSTAAGRAEGHSSDQALVRTPRPPSVPRTPSFLAVTTGAAPIAATTGQPLPSTPSPLARSRLLRAKGVADDDADVHEAVGAALASMDTSVEDGGSYEYHEEEPASASSNVSAGRADSDNSLITNDGAAGPLARASPSPVPEASPSPPLAVAASPVPLFKPAPPALPSSRHAVSAPRGGAQVAVGRPSGRESLMASYSPYRPQVRSSITSLPANTSVPSDGPAPSAIAMGREDGSDGRVAALYQPYFGLGAVASPAAEHPDSDTDDEAGNEAEDDVVGEDDDDEALQAAIALSAAEYGQAQAQVGPDWRRMSFSDRGAADIRQRSCSIQ